MTSSICHNAVTGDTGQLIDRRDGETYWIAKLKDSNCWMTQNLDLDLTNITLNSSNTDISNSWIPNLTSALWTGNTSTQDSPKYYDPGVKYCNTSGCNLVASTNGGHDAQGNYYSWNAATAGTGNADITANGSNVPASICPSGWRLPTGGTNGEFYQLVNGLNSAQITAAPYYFVYGGYIINSSLSSAGGSEYYWSATAYSVNNAYNLYFTSSSVYPFNDYPRYFGFSVRCVAR